MPKVGPLGFERWSECALQVRAAERFSRVRTAHEDQFLRKCLPHQSSAANSQKNEGRYCGRVLTFWQIRTTYEVSLLCLKIRAKRFL